MLHFYSDLSILQFPVIFIHLKLMHFEVNLCFILFLFGFSQLMVHVRLPLVNREFLMTRVDNERLVREDSQCRELLLEAMRYHLAPERRCALSTPRTMERKPKGAEPYLFAVGEYIYIELLVLFCAIGWISDVKCQMMWYIIFPIGAKCQNYISCH